MYLIAQTLIDPKGPAYAQVVLSKTEDGHGEVVAEKRIDRKGRGDKALREEAADVAALLYEAEAQRRRQCELF